MKAEATAGRHSGKMEKKEEEKENFNKKKGLMANSSPRLFVLVSDKQNNLQHRYAFIHIHPKYTKHKYHDKFV